MEDRAGREKDVSRPSESGGIPFSIVLKMTSYRENGRVNGNNVVWTVCNLDNGLDMDGDWEGELLFENDWLIGSYKLSMDKLNTLQYIEINIGRNISKDINNINLIKR